MASRLFEILSMKERFAPEFKGSCYVTDCKNVPLYTFTAGQFCTILCLEHLKNLYYDIEEFLRTPRNP